MKDKEGNYVALQFFVRLFTLLIIIISVMILDAYKNSAQKKTMWNKEARY